MGKKLFVAYGDNVMIERQNEKNDTIAGRVIHSNSSDLKYGDIVLYAKYDANSMSIGSDQEVDIVWRPKIRAILKEKE